MTRYHLRILEMCSIVLCVCVLTSCATTGKYGKILDTWIGSDINNLITSWGPPSNEYVMPNGKKMYTWLWVGGTRVVANYNQYLSMVTGGSVTYYCKTTFTVSKLGVVETWRWEGNACRSK